MVLFLAVCTVALALLMMPDVFVALGQVAVDNPAWGLGLLTVVTLIGVWIYRR